MPKSHLSSAPPLGATVDQPKIFVKGECFAPCQMGCERVASGPQQGRKNLEKSKQRARIANILQFCNCRKCNFCTGNNSHSQFRQTESERYISKSKNNNSPRNEISIILFFCSNFDFHKNHKMQLGQYQMHMKWVNWCTKLKLRDPPNCKTSPT